MKTYQDSETKLLRRIADIGGRVPHADPDYSLKWRETRRISNLFASDYNILNYHTWPLTPPEPSTHAKVFSEFIDQINSYIKLMGSEVEDVFKTLTPIRLNGVTYFLNKSALNIVSEKEEESEDQTPLVYAFYSKKIFNILPPLHVYPEDEDGADSYAKSFLAHLHPIHDRSKKNNITRLRSYENINRRTVLSSFMHDEDFSSPGKVIELKSLCSGQAYHYGIANYSQAKFRTKSCLAPALVPITVYDFKSKSYNKAYLYTFVFNSKIKRIGKYNKARRYFSDVLESLVRYEGSYFYDQEAYLQARYSSSLRRFIPSCSEQDYADLQGFPVTSNPTALLKHSDFLDLTAEYSYSEELRQKNLALKAKKTKAAEESSHIDDHILNYHQLFRTCRTAHSTLKIIEKNMLAARENYLKHQADLKTSVTQIPQTIKSLKANIRKSTAYKQAQKQLDEEFLKYKLSASKLHNQTLTNIIEDIELIHVSFKEKSTQEIYDLSDPKLNLAEIALSSESFSERYSLTSLHYRTKSPQQIRVNGSKTNVKVGGPYEIKITTHNILIRPASKDSYYSLGTALRRRDSIHIHTHPHSGGSYLSSDSTEFNWETCCLGEASTILWKAWGDANFSQIFIAVNIWLTSANSADVWGRRYKSFEDWSDHEAYQQYSSKYLSNQTSSESEEEPFQILKKQHSVETLQSPPEADEPTEDSNPTYTPYIRTSPSETVQ